MINIKKLICIVIGFLSPLILMFFIMDFMLWQAHDYDPNYSKIDRCLDHGGRWDYESVLCEYE